MNRLRWLLVLFCLALAVPMGYFVLNSQKSMQREEVAELRYFAQTLFIEMERELAALVQREEARAVDEYLPQTAGTGAAAPLSVPPAEPYILGYFQNNPDGSFLSPLDSGPSPGNQTAFTDLLGDLNRRLNERTTSPPEPFPSPAQEATNLPEKESREMEDSGPARRFLNLDVFQKDDPYRGQERKHVREIIRDQAQTVLGDKLKLSGEEQQRAKDDETAGLNSVSPQSRTPADGASDRDNPGFQEELRVEIDPFQSVELDENHVFLFRRILLGNQAYRQGLVIDVNLFLNHLAETHFLNQPMAGYSGLHLSAVSHGVYLADMEYGARALQPVFTLSRTFPRPFAFVKASISCDAVPRSPARQTLLVMTGILGTVLGLGLLAIYKSAAVAMDLADRKAGFVSSVTHELKTPLTNIRLYMEMLEQGMATTPEKEMEYFRIVNSESGRLSRLIQNVLEFARLERRQRKVNMRPGILEEVVREVSEAMAETLRKEGFSLRIEHGDIPPFAYDREAMVQILINCLDNSVKFGRESSRKEIVIRTLRRRDRVEVRVEDSGPGVDRRLLSRIFNDFYRADDSLTRRTTGTGIGLALVKRLAEAMGGEAYAVNRPEGGLAVILSFPLARKAA